MNERRVNLDRVAALTAAALATLALTGEAAASTGGASYGSNNDPALNTATNTAGHRTNLPGCPTSKKITARNFTPHCRASVMRELRASVYDDVSDTLAVATYQKEADIAVDGSIGPDVARHVRQGDALRVASPDPSAKGRELFIKKDKQVAYDLNNGVIKHIFSISSGMERHYRQMGTDGVWHEGNAHTPTDTFTINEVDGADYPGGGLGAMPYARKFDSDGDAVHTGNVDLDGRDSHGCVRVEGQTMVRYIVPEYGLGNTVKIVE